MASAKIVCAILVLLLSAPEQHQNRSRSGPKSLWMRQHRLRPKIPCTFKGHTIPLLSGRWRPMYNAGVICKTHLLTPGNGGASWMRHVLPYWWRIVPSWKQKVSHNTDPYVRLGKSLYCECVTRFVNRTVIPVCAKWCASWVGHFHEMVRHNFDANMRKCF